MRGKKTTYTITAQPNSHAVFSITFAGMALLSLTRVKLQCLLFHHNWAACLKVCFLRVDACPDPHSTFNESTLTKWLW